jgi:hypothetical protein
MDGKQMKTKTIIDYYTRKELIEIIKNFAYACNWDTADHDMAEHLGEKYFPIFIGDDDNET